MCGWTHRSVIRVGIHTRVRYVWTDTQDTIQVDRYTG